MGVQSEEANSHHWVWGLLIFNFSDHKPNPSLLKATSLTDHFIVCNLSVFAQAIQAECILVFRSPHTLRSCNVLESH